MCMFCAAIPAALAVGANAQARHNRDERQGAHRRGPRRTRVQPKTTTLLVVAGLAAASVVYHTQLGG